MPIIAQVFGVKSDLVQQTVTLFLLGAVVSCVFSGILADWYGRRKFLLFSYGMAVIGSVLCAFTDTSLPQLNIGRFLQGFGGVSSTVVGFTLIHDAFPASRAARLFGVMGIYFAVVPAIAPMVGGYVADHFGWQMNLYILLGLFTASFFAILWGIPDHVKAKREPLRMRDSAVMFRDRPFVSIILMYSLFVSGEWFIIPFCPFYFQDTLGFTSEMYGYFLGVVILWYALGSYIGGHYMERFGANNIIYAALGMGLFSAVMVMGSALMDFHSAPWLFVAFSIYLMAFGLMFPPTITKIFGYFPNLKSAASAVRTLCSTLFAYLGAQAAEIASEGKLIHLGIYFCLFSTLSFALFHFRNVEPHKVRR